MRSLAVSLFLFLVVQGGRAQDSVHVAGPVEYTYRTVDGKALKVFVFHPAKPAGRRSAIVLFHGGGWYSGEPSWAFGRARSFAGQGYVAIAVQYRLSDQKTVTPLEAMADARAAVRWTRSNAQLLRIDPNRVAAFGWSAGGHLAACTALFPDTVNGVHSIPDVLILISPALRLEKDRWVQRLLGTRADVSAISPVSHVRKRLPPTLILQGSTDTVTPLEGARMFFNRMIEEQNDCVLQVYPKVGHLFTPEGTRDDGWPQPDPKVNAMALQKASDYLRSRGFAR